MKKIITFLTLSFFLLNSCWQPQIVEQKVEKTDFIFCFCFEFRTSKSRWRNVAYDAYQKAEWRRYAETGAETDPRGNLFSKQF